MIIPIRREVEKIIDNVKGEDRSLMFRNKRTMSGPKTDNGTTSIIFTEKNDNSQGQFNYLLYQWDGKILNKYKKQKNNVKDKKEINILRIISHLYM